MNILKPYKRTYRDLTISVKGQGAVGDSYIFHPDYAQSSEKYIRGFLMIQKDYRLLLDYIEPADENLATYSFRIHELLMRTCIEIEANLVAILKENGFSKKERWTMADYKKVEKTHFLSAYKIKVTEWTGDNNEIAPFADWKNNESLEWWSAYNQTKHNRSENFKLSNLENLIKAISGLVALISSQFKNYDKKYITFLAAINESPQDVFENAIGNYFKVRYPNFEESDKYSFNWTEMQNNKKISFQNHEY